MYQSSVCPMGWQTVWCDAAVQSSMSSGLVCKSIHNILIIIGTMKLELHWRPWKEPHGEFLEIISLVLFMPGFGIHLLLRVLTH